LSASSAPLDHTVKPFLIKLFLKVCGQAFYKKGCDHATAWPKTKFWEISPLERVENVAFLAHNLALLAQLSIFIIIQPS